MASDLSKLDEFIKKFSAVTLAENKGCLIIQQFPMALRNINLYSLGTSYTMENDASCSF